MRLGPGNSGNFEDRRGGGGGGFGMAGMGIGGTAVLLVLSLLFGHNFFNDVGGGGGAGDVTANGAPAGGAPVSETPQEHELVQRSRAIFDDAQNTWASILPQMGTQFEPAKLVVFRNAVRSGCGTAQSAMGPFYCPMDQRVYLDVGFFEELAQKFGAPGDFAQGYVIAHEVGHHIQKLVGTEARVRQLQEQHPEERNALSVRLELQADCYAGVWGNSLARSTSASRGLDPGDAEEALRAASSVGDDRIQQSEMGSVHPESFTHGTAAQRSNWFQRGFQSGDPRNCDTFAGGI